MPTQQQWLNEGDGLFIGIPIQHVGMLASYRDWHPGWEKHPAPLALQLPSKETQHTSSHLPPPTPKKNKNIKNKGLAM